MNATTHITVNQGAALLWLRKAGGRAATNILGYVEAERAVCPVLLAAFCGLARCGLVAVDRLTLGGAPVTFGAYPAYRIQITDAGRSFEIDPASERRLDALLRRFDD